MFFLASFLIIVVGSSFIATPVTAVEPGERLMRTKLRIGGGDILMATSDVDADDWQLELMSGGGTRLHPQIADIIFEKSIDVDIEDSQMLMMGMDSGQYNSEMFINDTVNTGVKVEETSGNDDPTETTAFSIGTEFGYSKVTLAADSGDTYAGYSYTMDLFYDEDNDGVEDDSEYGYLSSFNDDCYIYVTMKADWSNISATAGDNLAEVDIYFTTSGTDLEIEAHVTADADGNTGWTNFDDGSADNKATFLYANADNQFVGFLFDLDTMNQYDEDDYSSIKGLDKIVVRNIGYGDSATSELWVYNIVFIKKADTWNYGTDKRPSITNEGQLDVDDDFIPSYTAASESDGGMYLNSADDIDLPITAVTESSSVTSAFSNLINTDSQLKDQDSVPLNWRKLKFESDQSGTNKEDDYNLALLPTTYTPSKILKSDLGGIVVEESFTWDLTGMDDIDTSTYLMTWDTSTDKCYVEDYLEYSKVAPDIWDHSDPALLVEGAWEGLASTYTATDDLKSAWASETDFSYIQLVLTKQPDTTTGDILKLVRQVRFHVDYVGEIPEKGGAPLFNQKLFTYVALGAGGLGLVATILLIGRIKKRRR
jgi:hypothetical protein